MNLPEFTISWSTLWRVVIMAAIVIILFLSKDILVATLLALIISSSLDPFVDFLEKRRIPRILGTLAIYLMVLLVIALIIYIVVPIVLVEFNSFIVNSNEILGSATETLGINQSIFQTIQEEIDKFTGQLLGGEATFISILSQVLGGLLFLVIITVLSFYLTVGKNGVEMFLQTILPPKQQKGVLDIYAKTRKKIGYWFTGQLFLSAFIGISVYIGLSILGVKYAFIIAISAAILELVPYVGPIFVGSLAILSALSTSFILGLYTLILFIAIQQFESHILIPAVHKYTVNLNPVIVILSLLIGGQVFGIIGIILAIPVAVSVYEILSSWGYAKQPEVIEKYE